MASDFLSLPLFVERFKLCHGLEECFSPCERPRLLALKNLKAVMCHKPMAAHLCVSCCIVRATNVVLTVRWTEESPHAPVALFGTGQVRVVLRLLYSVFVTTRYGYEMTRPASNSAVLMTVLHRHVVSFEVIFIRNQTPVHSSPPPPSIRTSLQICVFTATVPSYAYSVTN